MSVPVTPFQSTYSRKIQKKISSSCDNKKSQLNVQQNHETCNDLLRKTWFTYRCSPLHQFKCDTESLKLYSRLLSATFAANKQKMAVGLDDDDPPSKGVFFLAEGLAVQSDEPTAVKLTVYSRDEKLLGEMYLCSVNAEPLLKCVCNVSGKSTETERLSEKFIVFPLLLCRGTVFSRNIFFDWLKTEFDCSIVKLDFNSLSLAWMLGLWSTLSIKDSASKPAKIVWSFPLPGVGIDHIESSLESESISVLWKGAHSSHSDIITEEEVKGFLNGIEEHLTQHFCLKFQAFPLREIQLEIVHIHSDGKIKMFSRNHVYTVLSHLTCLAVERMRWTRRESSDT